MSGRLFAVVGPSGAGKDTLIAEIARTLPGLHVVRRVITRPTEAGGEPFEGVAPDEFERRRTDGAFVLDWQAHGLHYGIPAGLVELLDGGQDAIVNLSRAMLAEAAGRFARLHVLNVSARPEVLAIRLGARGRETPEDIRRRLERAALPLPTGLPLTEIDNSGALSDALRAALATIAPEGATVP